MVLLFCIITIYVIILNRMYFVQMCHSNHKLNLLPEVLTRDGMKRVEASRRAKEGEKNRRKEKAVEKRRHSREDRERKEKNTSSAGSSRRKQQRKMKWATR